MARLVLDGVDKIYGPRGKPAVHAVKAISMDIADGEIIGLLGSSGCGKTSTLRMVAGFETVSNGVIRLGEREINHLPPAQRNVAMAFEGYALYPPLRIRDNIGFALLRDRRPSGEVTKKVDEIAELLEIAEVLERYPPTISGGQQQRASLARALIRNADLTLLDEPMGQLEPRLRSVLRARIKDWLITRKLTTIIVTHDQTEALALCDRIAVMEGGELKQLGTPAELKERPANLFVASFIGEPPMNILDATVQRSDGRTTFVVQRPGGGEAFRLDVPMDETGDASQTGLTGSRGIKVGIRPHRIHVGDTGQLKATVTSNQWLGDQTHLGLDVAGCFLVAVADRAAKGPVGGEVSLFLPNDALHVFDAESGQALMHGSRRADEQPAQKAA